MALSLINVGTTPNDGTGDPLRTAFQTVNTALTLLNSVVFNVSAYGAVGDGTTNDAPAIQACIDAVPTAGGVVQLIDGTFLCNDEILLPSNITLVGSRSSILKMGATLDKPLLTNASKGTGTETDITLIGFTINGNKASQTPLAEGSGVKLYKTDRARIFGLYIYNTEGHGVHFNNAGAQIEGQEVHNCTITGAGSSNVGTYGSCLAITDGYHVRLSDLFLADSAKAGMRLSGTGYAINNVQALRNGNGGLVPVSGDFNSSTITGGNYSFSGPYANNDGMRLVNVKDVAISGVTCEQNAGAGILLLNGCENVTINGVVAKNNGQNTDAVTGTTSKNGIAVKDDGTANDGVRITNCDCYDDQGVATQEYGISVENQTANTLISSCGVGTNKTAKLNIASSADTVRIVGVDGYAAMAQSATAVPITATTATVDMVAATVAANSVARKSGIRLVACGTITGTAGTKLFSLNVGGSSLNFSTAAAGVSGDWFIDVEIWFNTTSSQRIMGRAGIGSTFVDAFYSAETQDYTSAKTIKLSGKLGDGADNITMNWYSIRPIE